MSISIPVLNSGGNVVEVCNRIGWRSFSDIVWSAYFRQVCCSYMAVGGSDASSSIGVIAELRKAPKIRLDAVFWSIWSLLMYPFCSLHQASTPKSRIGRTQVVYSCRRCRELSPHSLVCNLEDIWSALEVEAIFLSTWALKLSFLSKKTPSHRTTVEGFIMVPLGSVTGHYAECRRRWK